MESLRTLEEISDGRLYDIHDTVRADAGGCEKCSACCHDVGDLVVLTPYDIYEMMYALDVSFNELLKDKIELREDNKIKLPYLRMSGETKRCIFLNEASRCSIHAHRPNICRLFPLGRIYENGSFKYFLQINSCLKPHLKEVTIHKWLGINHYEENKAFILSWHQFLKALGFRLKFIRDPEELAKINQYLQDTFYDLNLKNETDFYTEFWRKLPEAKNKLGIL